MASARRLLAAKHTLQRQAGLELLRQLIEQERGPAQAQQLARTYAGEDSPISAAEQALLEAILLLLNKLGIADGQPCSGDDRDCASGICGDNFVCCREVCEAGYCDRQGVCHLPVPQGEPCLEDAECLSNVCDVFDGICCNRRCDLSEGCPFGTCGRVPEEPVPFPGNSSTGASALSSAANPCASCPSGTQRTDGLCTASNGDDDGCSTVGGRASRTGLFMVTLLPLGFWIARRGQLSRARRRRSQLAG